MSLPYPPDKPAQAALARRGGNVVINELAAKRLGFKDPRQAVGKTFGAAYVDNELGLVPSTIIGVVKDSRFRSIKQPIDPIMFPNSAPAHSHMIVRFNGDPAEVRAGVGRYGSRSPPTSRSTPSSATMSSRNCTRPTTRGRRSSPPSPCWR